MARRGGRGTGIEWSPSAEIVALGMILNNVVVSLPLGCPRKQGAESICLMKSKRMEFMEW